jgi:hypothetical protein
MDLIIILAISTIVLPFLPIAIMLVLSVVLLTGRAVTVGVSYIISLLTLGAVKRVRWSDLNEKINR